MNTTELDDLIKSGMANIANERGFKCRSSREGGGLIKKTKAVIMDCGYAKNSWVDEHQLSGFHTFIGYPVLENLVMPILVKHSLIGSGVLKISFTYQRSKEAFKHRFVYEQRIIMTAEKLQPFIDTFKLFFLEDALPFFEQFSDLNKFYHFIKDENDPDVLSKILLSIMHEFKLATIYRLCNDSRYESYITNYYNSRKIVYEFQPHDLDSQRYWKAIQELKEVLDRTSPIYNI